MKTRFFLALLLITCSVFADVVTVKTPVWTSKFDTELHTCTMAWWTLTPEMLGGTRFPRTNKFIASPVIPNTNYNKDYVGTLYDKGHQSPAEDNGFSAEAEARCFGFDNMIAQAHLLNEQTWLRLESYCRSLVLTKHESLFIVCGGVGFHTTIGPDKVSVPDFCWKAIKEGNVWSAWLFPNVSTVIAKPYTGYAIPMADLDAKLGFKVEDIK